MTHMWLLRAILALSEWRREPRAKAIKHQKLPATICWQQLLMLNVHFAVGLLRLKKDS